MNFHLCCFHLLAKNRKKIEAVTRFEEGHSQEVIQAENILIQEQPLPTKIDRVKVTESSLTRLDTQVPDNSSLSRDYTAKRRFTLPSFDEIRRGSKIGPFIEPDTSFNYSSVWPLWPKDIRTGTTLPFYLSDPEEIATSDDDDDDVVVSKFGETSNPINDDFDEIIVKTRRSNSEAHIQFARPLTGHPRRRTIIGFGTAPDSPRIVISPDNDKDEESDQAVIQDDSRTSPIFQAYGSLPSDVDSYLRFSSHFQQEKNEVVETLPPKNRLDDDLARMHAEKFKSKIAWIHHNRQPDEPNEDAIRLEEEDGIIFIDSQGKHDSMFDFSPEVQFKTSDIEVDDDNNNLSLHSSLISSTIGSRKSSLESATNLLVNKAIMTILDDQPPLVEEIVKTNGRERPSTAIPLICIDFADDHDVHAEANRIPKINHELDKKATRRHNSCPSSFLTVPTDSMHSSKRKQEAMRPILPRRDFAFREIGVSNIINTIEKRKIKQKRRSKRRRDAFFLY